MINNETLDSIDHSNLPPAPEGLDHSEGIGWQHCLGYMLRHEDSVRRLADAMSVEFHFLTGDDDDWQKAARGILKKMEDALPTES